MSVQVRRRRESAAFLASFVGAQGELLVDTTNNRVQVHDGVTPGGWPAAKLADIAQRTAVTDANYTVKATDRTLAYTALTAARSLALPAAATYPTGTQLVVLDESGSCSAAITITLVRAGTDTISGAATAVIAAPYGFVALTSDGGTRWTIVDQGGNVTLQSLLLKGNASSLAAQGTATFGASDSATRFAAFDTFGRTTWRYDDAGFVSGPVLNNYGLTAAGQGAQMLAANLGTGGAQVAQAGAIRIVATDSFASTATASAKWQFIASKAGSAGLGLEVTTDTASSPTLRASTSFTVATLPAAGAAGRAAFCSNARMLTGGGTLEAAGSGTGGLVVDNGTAWKIAGTAITASA